MKLDIKTYINCLWNYFNTFCDSIKKKNKNQEKKWLKILERSALNLNTDTINLLLKDPNNIFKIVDYIDMDIYYLLLLKSRYFILLYWLNYLLIKISYNEEIEVYNKKILLNWINSIDTLVSIFKSRNSLMLVKRDNIFKNLKELEKITIKCPNLDKIHQLKMENQLKVLRYILNIDILDELQDVNKKIKVIENNKFNNLSINFCEVLNNREKNILENNIFNILDLFSIISNELLLKEMKLKTLLFTKNSNYERIINMNLEYKSDLIQYKDYIFNRLTLSWGTLDKIKLIELKINIKYDENINLLISKTDKFCYLVFKMIEQYNNNNIINILDDYKINQKQIIESLNKLKEKTDHNHEIISKLEKEYNYSDLKDLDIEFYYQFLIHINSLINAMSQRTKIRINEDKYLSNEYLSEKKDFQNLVKNLSNHFVTKKELKEEISRIEKKNIKSEEKISEFIMGTIVISSISLHIWKKIINFRLNN